MNRSLESALRFVNLTSAGFLAGSLGFGALPLVPGREAERTKRNDRADGEQPSSLFNAIGPVALATSLILAIGDRKQAPSKRTLDVLSTLGLAGVLAATALVTVPITRQLDEKVPADYPSAESASLAKNWNRAQSVRTALGVGAFLCAAAANATARR